MNTFRTACPLNCWDQCSFLVTVSDGRVTEIEPDPARQVTGFICAKGKKHLRRVNHPARLTHPLLKTGRGFKRISWEEALAVAAQQISDALARYGPLSLLHYYDSGHGGILKNIESRFFSALGGCTTHRGGLCWSAGLAAQRYDFGAALSHSLEDLVHSRLIMIWGRNPAATAVHQLPFIRQARRRGARVVLVDPLRTATAVLADTHIPVKPGTDGALALGMAHLIVRQGLHDENFVQAHCSGFTPFQRLAASYPPETVSAITGISRGMIEKLARDYASARPAAILLGYGPQRHSNGGSAVRAVDALAALTGNIGMPGGGVNYANFRVSRFIDHPFLEGDDLAPDRRHYPKPKLAEALERLEDPPVRLAYISRANPLNQVGDSRSLQQAFQRVPFKIVAEHFLTDTAAAADLVLPCTFFLEEEELYYNSMSHCYLAYGPKILDAPGECRHEYTVLQTLARELGTKNFPALAPGELLARLIKPLTEEKGITIEQLKQGPCALPGGDAIPWQDFRFATPDGKYNFNSPAAGKEGCDPLPVYREPVELSDRVLREQGYRYWFVTPHPADSIHSAHRLPEDGGEPRVYLHPDTGRHENIANGEMVRVSSRRGSLEARARLRSNIPPGTVLVYEGWWKSSRAAVNNLTPDRLTDMGGQAALYDCLCRIDTLSGARGKKEPAQAE